MNAYAIAKDPSRPLHSPRWVLFHRAEDGALTRVCSYTKRKGARGYTTNAPLIPWPEKHADTVSIDHLLSLVD